MLGAITHTDQVGGLPWAPPEITGRGGKVRERNKKEKKMEKNKNNPQQWQQTSSHLPGSRAWRSSLLPAGILVLLVTQGRPTEIKGSKTSCKILVKMLMVSGPLKTSWLLLNHFFYLLSGWDLLRFELTVFMLIHCTSWYAGQSWHGPTGQPMPQPSLPSSADHPCPFLSRFFTGCTGRRNQVNTIFLWIFTNGSYCNNKNQKERQEL